MLLDDIVANKTWNDQAYGFGQKILERLDAWELLLGREPKNERFFLLPYILGLFESYVAKNLTL